VKPLGGDTALRLASLGLAAGLWFVIVGRQTAERGVGVPVELRNVPRDLELTGDPVNSVDVRVRASPGLINSLETGKLLATIDLAGAAEGERIVQLTPAAVQVPFGFRVVKITPSLLTLNLERTERKTVPVRPRVTGRPASGFEIKGVASDPPEVRVAGPRSRVQEMESAFTEPLSVEGAQSNVSDVVNMGLDDPLLRVLGSPRVRATVRIRELEGERTLDAVAVEVRGGELSVRPASVRVIVAGPASLLRTMTTDDVHAFVDLAAATPGAAASVGVDLSAGHAGLRVKEIVPAAVTVRTSRATRKGT